MVQKGKEGAGKGNYGNIAFGMDHEMETLIQALVIQINMVWNHFHGIIHELLGYAHALSTMHAGGRTVHHACSRDQSVLPCPPDRTLHSNTRYLWRETH